MTTKCFANAFKQNSLRWSEGSNSREILDHVRTTLLTQATANAIEALNQPIQQLDELDDGDEAHDTIKLIFAAALQSSTSSAQLVWSNVSTTHDSSDRDSLGGESTTYSEESMPPHLDKFSLTEALGDPDLRATDALLHLKAALQKSLRSVVPLENALFETIMNASEWQMLESSVDGLQRLSLGLQRELERTLSLTQAQLNRSMAATNEILEHVESQVASSVDSRDRRWKTAIQSILASYERSWRTAGEKVRTLAVALRVMDPNFVTRSHCRDLTLENRSSVDADFVRHELYLIQRREELHRETPTMHTLNSDPDGEDTTLIVEATSARTRDLYAACVGAWRAAERLLYFADWGSVCVKILEVVFALWTDSYSVLSPVDIRGISSLHTLVRSLVWLVWTQCPRTCSGADADDVHSFSSVAE